MLKKVSIQNFGLIKDVNLEFKSGFTAITGETGAGKSFFTNALRLGFGGRSKGKRDEKSVIEIEFGEHIFRRILDSQKSRFFINDIPELSIKGQDFVEEFLDFHGQHDHLFLKKPEAAGILFDNSLKDKTVKNKFEAAFLKYKTAKNEVKKLQAEIHEFENQKEFWEFQQEKMSEIKFSLEELHFAEKEVHSSQDNLKLKPLIEKSIEILAGENNSVLSQMDEVETMFLEIDTDLAETIKPLFLKISDVVQVLEKKLPEENEALENSQNLIEKVSVWQKRFGVASPEALLEKKQNINENLRHLYELHKHLEVAENNLKDSLAVTEEKAQKLSIARKEIKNIFGQNIQKKCQNLGMPPAQFKVRLTPSELTSQGFEKVEFYFSSNISQTLKPLKETASGGELARITLALKHFWPVRSTMVFDEIDTGVSGAIAELMAQEIKILSQQKQILSITHSPQIAAKADHHFMVEKTHFKNFTETTIREIKGEERIEVIASMLSGSKITREAKDAARKLMDRKNA